MNFISCLLLALTICAALPIFALTALCAAALLPQRRPNRSSARPPAAVLIPAHDESAGIAATLNSISPQLLPQDRLIVIADNCTDNTAQIARAHGAVALERQSETEKGKGFALAHGMQALKENPPAVVVMMDADCLVQSDSLDALIRQAAGTGRPAQAIYLMASPPRPSVRDHLSAFAFLMKNLVRPRGLDRLGSPVLLTGTGMAFPWQSIADIPMASGNIVEDMQLGIDLALRRRGARLCAAARVTGQLPTGEKAAFKQRTRWEHGHLRTLLLQGPRLFFAGQWGLTADLLIPPLALLAILWLCAAAVIALGPITNIAGWQIAAWVHAGSGLLFFLSAGIGWWRFGRGQIPLLALLSVPLYMAWKIPMYLGFVTRPEKEWVRTQR